MKTVSFVASTLNLKNFGKCSTCMQISFAAMAASWLLMLGTMPLGTAVNVALSIIAVALTLVWFAHICARAIRSHSHKQAAIDPGRREFGKSFGRALIGAAVVSVGVLSAPNSAESAECGQACSKSNDNCPNGCTCWWELKRCVKLN